MSDAKFENEKKEALATLALYPTKETEEDLDPVEGTDGGTLDLPLIPFLDEINDLKSFYTKSSCMGHEFPEMWSCHCCDGPAAQHLAPFLAIEVLPSLFDETWERFENEDPSSFWVTADDRSPTGILFSGDGEAPYDIVFKEIVEALREISDG
jgi:hypothetical protein